MPFLQKWLEGKLFKIRRNPQHFAVGAKNISHMAQWTCVCVITVHAATVATTASDFCLLHAACQLLCTHVLVKYFYIFDVLIFMKHLVLYFNGAWRFWFENKCYDLGCNSDEL